MGELVGGWGMGGWKWGVPISATFRFGVKLGRLTLAAGSFNT